MKKFFGLFLAVSYTLANPLSAWSIDLDQGFSAAPTTESEYFSLNRDKRMSIQVNFVSGVQKPGIHHLPDNTHLLEAISLAGGVQPDADPGKVFVKRKKKDQFETISYDLNEIITGKQVPYPELRNNDTIMIASKTHFSENTALILGIVTSLVAIGTGYLVLTRTH